MRFSEKTGCFYPEWGKYDTLPDDLITVPDEEFVSAVNRPQGTILKAVNGHVVIKTIIDPRTPAEIAAGAKDIAAQKIRDEASVKLAALGNPYSEEEQKTWATQESEARAWLQDNTVPCPLITGMATNRGIPLSLLVQKIIENADLFKEVSGKILGDQQKALDQLG